MDAARDSAASRPSRLAVKVENPEPGKVVVNAPHSDGLAMRALCNETFGTSSAAFADVALSRLGGVVCGAGKAPIEDQINAALAMLGAIAPQNELEAALAEQIIGAHALSMDLLFQAKNSQNTARTEAYVNMATKTQRTTATLVETLSKLRTGGKQQVEVRYVYVDARGSQNLISAGGMPQGPIGNLGQSHATAIPDASGPAMRGSDAIGLPMSVAGSEGPEPVPDAWRHQSRSPERQGERPISDRSLHRGSDAGPNAGPRARPVRKGKR
jgi:hypothetical protein